MKTQRQQQAMLQEAIEHLAEFVADVLNDHGHLPAVQEGVARINKQLGSLHISLTADTRGKLSTLTIGVSAAAGAFAGLTAKSKEVQHLFRNPETLEIERVERLVFDGADVAKSFPMIVINLGGEEMEGVHGPEN